MAASKDRLSCRAIEHIVERFGVEEAPVPFPETRANVAERPVFTGFGRRRHDNDSDLTHHRTAAARFDHPTARTDAFWNR